MQRILTLLCLVALFALMTSGCSDSNSITSVEDTTPPATPLGLVAHVGGDGEVKLLWADNTELDFAAYNVYRHEYNQDFALLESTETSHLVDTVEGASLHNLSYCITALDHTGNESAMTQTIQVIIESSEEHYTETNWEDGGIPF
ncbi:MAG: hypothetical protein GY835_15045 [bacterium]|nr:hypothetical protein [bacterium]